MGYFLGKIKHHIVQILCLVSLDILCCALLTSFINFYSLICSFLREQRKGYHGCPLEVIESTICTLSIFWTKCGNRCKLCLRVTFQTPHWNHNLSEQQLGVGLRKNGGRETWSSIQFIGKARPSSTLTPPTSGIHWLFCSINLLFLHELGP